MLLSTIFLLFFPVCYAIDPVDILDLNSYLGHWYQVYTNNFNEFTFESSAYCATADYGINTNGTLSVLNKARLDTITGDPFIIEGWGQKSINAKFQGELSVSLQGSPFLAPYWIFKVGSIDQTTDLYKYAIVSDPFQLTLFVLARNVTDFYDEFNGEVLEYLQVNGWNTSINSPIEIIQTDCKYF